MIIFVYVFRCWCKVNLFYYLIYVIAFIIVFQMGYVKYDTVYVSRDILDYFVMFCTDG